MPPATDITRELATRVPDLGPAVIASDGVERFYVVAEVGPVAESAARRRGMADPGELPSGDEPSSGPEELSSRYQVPEHVSIRARRIGDNKTRTVATVATGGARVRRLWAKDHHLYLSMGQLGGGSDLYEVPKLGGTAVKVVAGAEDYEVSAKWIASTRRSNAAGRNEVQLLPRAGTATTAVVFRVGQGEVVSAVAVDDEAVFVVASIPTGGTFASPPRDVRLYRGDPTTGALELTHKWHAAEVMVALGSVHAFVMVSLASFPEHCGPNELYAVERRSGGRVRKIASPRDFGRPAVRGDTAIYPDTDRAVTELANCWGTRNMGLRQVDSHGSVTTLYRTRTSALTITSADEGGVIVSTTDQAVAPVPEYTHRVIDIR